MSRNNMIVIIIAVILIIICIIVGSNDNGNDEVGIVDETGKGRREATYNTVTNEITGIKEYVIYDKETGREITRVEEEHQLKIYEIDPNYEELPVDMQEETQITQETAI